MSELKLQQCRLDGRYDVLDCLGRGSYSEVYVARDSAASNGQPHTVVIKALNPYLQGMPDPELERTLVENFRNEAVALDRVRHPNIISRLGHGTAIDLQGRTFHYLVLEYLSGGDLQAFVRNHPLPLEGALFYLEQVCNGLAHAHKHGVIHRDIKPQNLLLTADQHTLKIADFGVAKIEAAEGAITRVGTDLYAAPEHHPLLQTGPLDTASLNRRVLQLTPAADVYSLAKTTYMLLTGEAPRRFSQKHIDSLPPTLFAQPWAQYVLRVLERATQPDPRRRHQSVEEFWQEIKDATLAQTRPLRGGGEDDESLRPQPARPPEGAKRTPPPPAPVFDREGRAAGSSRHHRIVVPIAGEAKAPPAVRAGHTTAPPPAVWEDPRAEFYEDEARAARRSSRLRNLLVALALLLAFSGMLYATYRYVNNMRGRSGGGQQQSGGAAAPASPAGREFLTTTDVNLRDGPDSAYPKVGLAEKGSRVKVLQASGKWYQVQVVERGRPKEDPASADEGWAHSALLRAR
ncbi:MAG TPA: protein kinase [Pyrinomonadaceae bacterium]|nr:protein kinase [Pyrinomonadaceae bacterium]